MLPEEIIRSMSCPLQPQPTGLESFGRLPSPLKAVLFDIYGTLLVSASGDIHAGSMADSFSSDESLRPILRRYQVPLNAHALQQAVTREIQRMHCFLRSQGTDFPEVDIQVIWKALFPEWPNERILSFALEYELAVNPVWPMPGATDLLALCRQAGLVMGIISNAQFYTPLLLRVFFNEELVSLGFHPSVTLFSYQEAHAKPSAVLFQKASNTLQAMGIAPSDTLYLGNDMRKDVIPAAAVGFRTALFAGDQRSLRGWPSENEQRPDLLVTDLRQLPDRWLL